MPDTDPDIETIRTILIAIRKVGASAQGLAPEQVEMPALDALDRLAARVGEGWRPIESAPKDGTWILLTGCNRSGVVIYGCWIEESASSEFEAPTWYGYWFGHEGPCAPPTHWRPLPPPPEPNDEP